MYIVHCTYIHFYFYFLQGVKLGGYVSWVQGVEYPDCPDCKVEMKTTFLQVKYVHVNHLLLALGNVLCPNLLSVGMRIRGSLPQP